MLKYSSTKVGFTSPKRTAESRCVKLSTRRNGPSGCTYFVVQRSPTLRPSPPRAYFTTLRAFRDQLGIGRVYIIRFATYFRQPARLMELSGNGEGVGVVANNDVVDERNRTGKCTGERDPFIEPSASLGTAIDTEGILFKRKNLEKSLRRSRAVCAGICSRTASRRFVEREINKKRKIEEKRGKRCK
ncbi:hypothetical protein EVAR_12212_1 [Eumeta japonica]|uniref:Uncharacterized protein n=1 Tax=Eumeta variegata TaxID=151549 RepID=A0A4C1UID6_EUMVA|nr:hypothetical protein EVAR_12212_1 [Eumeta japonica]